MPGTRRVPLNRTPTQQVSRRAALLWRDRQMLRCVCPKSKTPDMCAACERAWSMDHEISRELQLRPWQFPAAIRVHPGMAGPDSIPLSDPGGVQMLARMRSLDEAVQRLEAENV
jgi:hypothetical protein